MTGERTDGTGGDGADTDVDERLVGFLRTGDRPRHLASEVSATLGLPRGRVRTRLQALADEGRVVRTDAGGTARWAVPERADEPESDPEPGSANGASDGAGPDEGSTGASAAGTDDRAREDEGSTPAADEPDAGAVTVPAPEDDPSDAAGRTDVPATASGPSGESPDRPSDGRAAEPAAARSAGRSSGRRPAVVAALGLVAVLVLVVALGRLRRE